MANLQSGHGSPVTLYNDVDQVIGISGTPLVTSISGSVTSSPLTSTAFTPTQVTVPTTTNGILVLAANAARDGASILNLGPATVYISSAATGLTTSNGFAIPGGAAYNIDSPLYLGAIYGIVATGTQVVTVAELS